jgi:hypothetical protein
MKTHVSRLNNRTGCHRHPVLLLKGSYFLLFFERFRRVVFFATFLAAFLLRAAIMVPPGSG